MNNSVAGKPRPGRPGISYADVEAVALAILKEGGTPGYTAVHARLGRGSSKTIGDHLQRFWISHVDAESEPPALSANLLSAIRNEVRTQATALAASFAARAKTAEEDRITLMRELGEAADAAEQRASEVKALEAAVAARDGALTELRNRLFAADEREQSSRKEIELLGAELNSARNFLAQGELADRIVASLKERLLQAENRWTEAPTRDADSEKPSRMTSENPETLASQLAGKAKGAVPGSSAPRSTGQTGGHRKQPASKLTIAKPGVLTVTRNLIKARGIVSAAEIRKELLQSGVPLNSGTIRNLASTLSQARDLVYNREKQGWTLRSHDASPQMT